MLRFCVGLLLVGAVGFVAVASVWSREPWTISEQSRQIEKNLGIGSASTSPADQEKAGGTKHGEHDNENKKQTSLVGSWTLSADDGSTITLTITDKDLNWSAEMPGKGTTTLVAPRCEVTDDGLVFGYLNEFRWTNGVDSRATKRLAPFAFRFKRDGDKLTLSEMRLYSFDEKTHKSMAGEYKRAPEVAAMSATLTGEVVKR